MTNKPFYCYSLNLDSFLRSRGLEPYDKGKDEEGFFFLAKNTNHWEELPNLRVAELYLKDRYSEQEVREIRDKAHELRGTVTLDNGDKVKYRTRRFYIYEKDESLGESLEKWSETKPSN